ncbi:6995_t:CDS:2 [Ambispora leptoticha]|uniref:6995_t:CDS:1 n=1 Tax=Ambispora leptoticha TaxID=144679 RepID=A0A9N9BPL3_9GLOM|nr:6995_t:CDS:2 [Ambispora leptoticha]
MANDDDEKKMNTENSSQDEVDESLKFVLRPDDDSQKVTESMIGKVERTTLIVDDVDLDLEKTFEDYHNDLCHSDIMDLRPGSKFTKKSLKQSRKNLYRIHIPNKHYLKNGKIWKKVV